MHNFFQPIAHTVTKLFLEDREYEVSYFELYFSQETDHKGQPQHETNGGQFKIVLKEGVPDSIYDWAKRANKQKSGKIIFYKELVSSELIINFSDAYCIQLTRHIDNHTGTFTTLVVSPRKIELNGFTHDNKWKE